jgi:uncharacterized protein (TIGR02145 family)
MKSLLYLIPILIISITSCRKDPKPTANPTPITSVTISSKTYTVAKIGNKYWTSANFDAQGGVPYTGDSQKPEYGNYYTYPETKVFVLPAGWRVPTYEDYKDLMSINSISTDIQITANNKKITSTTHWRNVKGTNTSGFNALPAGFIFNNGLPLDGDIAEFWISDGKTFSIMESGNLDALRVVIFGDSGNPNAPYRFNVRFVKDVN